MINKVNDIINYKKVMNNISVDCLIISVLCCLPMFSFICNIDNILPISFFCLMVFTVIYKKEKVLNIHNIMNKKRIIVYFLVVMFFIIMNILIFGLNEESFKRLLYFCVYGILPTTILFALYISEVKFEYVKIFRYINCFYAVFSVFIYNHNFWNYPIAERMPMSYYFLPLLLSVFYEFVLDKKTVIKYKCIKIVIYIVFYYPYLRFTLEFMSRGAILAIFFCVVCTVLCYLKKEKRIQTTFFLFALSIIIVVFGLDILEFIHNILEKCSIHIGFVEKNIMLLESNSIGNGRGIIYQNAIRGITDSPLLGKGIGDFQTTYGTYPHNFILQMLYECGLFYAVLLCFPIFYAFIKIIYDGNRNIEDKCFYLFIFSTTIVRLLLSFEYWLDLFFWICLFMSLVFTLDEYKIEKAGRIL